MIPNALEHDCQHRHHQKANANKTHVHICHIMTNAPRICGGAHSAPYTGTVALLGPIPMPRKKRAMKRWGHEFVTPCQMQVAKEKNAATKMVPRRPRTLFKGSVSQHPMNAQQSYVNSYISYRRQRAPKEGMNSRKVQSSRDQRAIGFGNSP